MKLNVLTAALGLTLSFSAFATTVKALPTPFPFKRIVVFGDSLSDQRDVFLTTRILNWVDKKIPVIPDPNYYYQGRFSNGPTWIEDVTQQLQLDLQNNAWGGATINDSLSPPSMMSQLGLDEEIKQVTKNNTPSLYVFWFGGNDYIHGLPTTMDTHTYVNQTIAKFQHYLDEAINDYQMKYILVVNMPDVVKAPFAKQLDDQTRQALTNVIQWHNDGLNQVIAAEQAAHPTTKIALFDTKKELDDELANPQSFGLTNVTDACLHSKSGQFTLTRENQTQLDAYQNARIWGQPKFKGIDVKNNGSLFAAYKIGAMKDANDLQVCGDYATQDQYMFWDDVHPTRAEHKILASKAIEVIKANFSGD